ncbi:unnamed protein product [Linum trigynum]|uniref:RING-type domain-containing protein n=1 Tax=Linum trigynum TaxID=586398 RepID=A0AAV2FU51_9ROSI
MSTHNPNQLATPPPSPLPTPPPYSQSHDKQLFIVSGLALLVIISSICMICITGRTSNNNHRHQNNAADAPTRHDCGRYDDKEQIITTTVTVTAEEEEEECAVCLEGMKEGDECGVVKRCEHMYHKPCIDRWLLHSDRCPLCRLHIWTAPHPHHHRLIHPATTPQLHVV